MSRIARGFPPTRRIACPISMGHYQRSLVSVIEVRTMHPVLTYVWAALPLPRYHS